MNSPRSDNPAPPEDLAEPRAPADGVATPAEPIAPSATGSEPDVDPDQELDVWWGAYAGRAMLFSFTLCALLTLAVAAGGWYFWHVRGQSAYFMRHVVLGLTGAIWFVQGLRWAYRTVSINYRLTTHRLFRDRGFHNPTAGTVILERVTDVAVEPRTALEQLVHVGRIRVTSEDDTPPLVLEGVYQPEHVAAEIRRQVQRARERWKTRLGIH